jgi:RND family efflux transporter MFP subunit
MKRVRSAVAGVALLAAAFAAGALSAGRRGGDRGEREVLYYVDPMHPAYTSDAPGIAPDCGMQLEPVYADGGGPAHASGGGERPPGTILISSERQQLAGVRLGAVERGPTKHTLRLFGRVATDESRLYVVNSAVHGYVRAVADVTTGSRVRKGQWLATIFTAESRTPAQAYVTALQVLEAASRRDALAAELVSVEDGPALAIERLKSVGMSAGQIEEIRRTREVPLTVRIVSPADGFVLSRSAFPGQKFGKETEWFRVANLDRVWILADVFEGDARLVAPGMEAQVVVPGRGTRLAGIVADVLPQADPATGALQVRLEVDNPGHELRPGSFVDVELPVELPAALAVPADAVIDSGLRKTVFVARGGGVFEPRVVETGWRVGDRVEIVRGLSPHERVVVSGALLVDAETRRRAAAAGIHGAAERDPVCGMEVDEGRARAAGRTVEVDGRTLFFCSDTCKHDFEATARASR